MAHISQSHEPGRIWRPNSTQVRRGTDLVENDPGCELHWRHIFGLAAEHYAAQHAEKSDKVKFTVIGDDVGRTQGGVVGRRGLAGVVPVYKIAGALTAQGASLDKVYLVAKWVAGRIGTIGVGLENVIYQQVPAGNARLSPVPPLAEFMPLLLDIASTKDAERAFLPFKDDVADEVVLLVNNLGGLSELEMGGVVGAIGVRRVLAGAFMTSLNMPGFSLSLLLLPHPNEAGAPTLASLLALLDAPAQTPGWKWNSGAPPLTPTPLAPAASSSASITTATSAISAADPAVFLKALQGASAALAAAEPEITRMDTIAGDGDCGLTLKAGAGGVTQAIAAGKLTGKDLVADVRAITKVAETEMGGTSGALFTNVCPLRIFFSALAQGLQSASITTSTTTATPELWAAALAAAPDKLYTYTRARPPSRTLVDPLAGFIDSFGGFDFEPDAGAVAAVRAAAEHTRDVDARAGRSAERVPDPGAWGVVVILEALLIERGERGY
ncbi:dihydroxyacetone kinase [Mycena vitilis]|nr:dihydroxyacetone kinase [Mycena vitilis]